MDIAKYTAEQLHHRKVAKKVVYNCVMQLLLVFFSIVFVFPLLWMLSVSLQTESEMMLSVNFWDQLIPNTWRWRNYVEMMQVVPFGRYFLNSAIVTSLTVVGTVISASIVAYGFAKLRWPGRGFVLNLMLATMMLPSFVLMVPTFKMYSAMGFYDTWVPLILPAFLGGGAFNIYLIVQFYMSVPKELSESAKIDGAGHLRIWASIILPLCKPVIATVAIFAFMFSWNDFMGPLIYISDSNLLTVALGLRAFQSQQSTQWGYLMAGSVVSMLPMLALFIFCQRFFVEGVKMSGIKS